MGFGQFSRWSGWPCLHSGWLAIPEAALAISRRRNCPHCWIPTGTFQVGLSSQPRPAATSALSSVWRWLRLCYWCIGEKRHGGWCCFLLGLKVCLSSPPRRRYETSFRTSAMSRSVLAAKAGERRWATRYVDPADSTQIVLSMTG